MRLNGFNLVCAKTKISGNGKEFTNNSLAFGKSCEDLSWNHRKSTRHRSETNGIAQRALRRVKEGTSAVLLQSGLDERWPADSMECYCSLRNVQDLLADGKTSYERRFGELFKGSMIPFGAMVKYYPISTRDQTSPIWTESSTWNFHRMCVNCGRNLERRYYGNRH